MKTCTAFLKTPQAQLLFASVIKAEEARSKGMRQNDPNFDTNAGNYSNQ